MKAVLLLAFSIHLASAAPLCLHYIYTAVNAQQNFLEFTAVDQVHGEHFMYCGCNISHMIPKNEWIKKVDDDDPDYWNRNTQIQHRTQEIFKVHLATLEEQFNQTEGVHTVQLMYGCELHDDGTKRGYMQYSYDGEDFISLDLNTLTWSAKSDKAKIIKQEWDSDASHCTGLQKYLENTCIRWLQKYAGYGNNTLERKDPPEVTLFQKDSSSPVLCHATGFFPSGLIISWKKNGEDMHEDVELGETLPNEDATFQMKSILKVSPEELDNNEYTCVVQHSGLEKELELRVADRRILNMSRRLVGVVMAVYLFIGCVGLFFILWKKNGQSTSEEEEDKFTRHLQIFQSSSNLCHHV